MKVTGDENLLDASDYYEGLIHRLNREIEHLIGLSRRTFLDLAMASNMSTTKFSRHVNGHRPWAINDLIMLLRVLEVSDEDTERLLRYRRAMDKMERITKPFAGILSDDERAHWEALAHAPVIYIQSGQLLPFPIRSREYQMSAEQMLQEEPIHAAKKRALMTMVAERMIDNGAQVRMLCPQASLVNAEKIDPDHSENALWGQNWEVRSVASDGVLHQAMMYPFAIGMWPDQPIQDLMFITDGNESIRCTREWQQVTRYRQSFESCWDSPSSYLVIAPDHEQL